jgi:hypothetical protein
MSEEHVSADLLEQARARLRGFEGKDNESDDLGERVQLAPGDHFLGRYRGEAIMVNKEGDQIPVVALWDADGRHRFHYRNASLVSELDAARPEVGDAIAIVRGEDRSFEAKGGELRTMHRYAVSTKPSTEPLPNGSVDSDADVPF